MVRERLLWTVLLLSVCFSACSRRSNQFSLDVTLPRLSGGEGKSLASCPTPKCLTVYVAPWCGYCRAATPTFLALRTYLQGQDVATRFVVGLSRGEDLRQYAQVFGPDTLLDPEGRLKLSGGVPHFVVSTRDGRILRDVAGYPMGVDSIPEFASYYGLP
ncbi:MAG: hypothetical protein HY921_00645 [Elusimicrobia bacterium]|nr:hypothetical protein [Elusimicrobiota bacterium]